MALDKEDVEFCKMLKAAGFGKEGKGEFVVQEKVAASNWYRAAAEHIHDELDRIEEEAGQAATAAQDNNAGFRVYVDEIEKLIRLHGKRGSATSIAAPDVKAIAERWASMDAFIFAKRYPDSWIDHARRDIPNLITWLKTEQEMHAAWRKRAEEAERDLDPPVCRLQFPDGTVPGNAREAAEGWKKWHDQKTCVPLPEHEFEKQLLAIEIIEQFFLWQTKLEEFTPDGLIEKVTDLLGEERIAELSAKAEDMP